ncbi:MAG: penicillin-binding protein activator LpoB [Planctomycetota bacterium]
MTTSPMMRESRIVLIACTALLLVACGTSVTRNDPGQTLDLSGRWNAEDSRRVADTMITEALSNPWHELFQAQKGSKPMVRIGRVQVRSNGDVIDTEIFTNDLRRAFINSGQVGVVASSDEVGATRTEQRDQETHAREETRSEAFQETGADFLLGGTIKVQDDQLDNVVQKFYSVDLILTHIETQEQVWIGNEKIAKVVKNGRFR